MKCKIFSILILPLFLVSCTIELELPTPDEAKAAVMAKIKSANDRWASGDVTGFTEVAAQDIIWIDELGAQIPISGKVALGKYLESFTGQVPPHKHELLNLVFQIYGDIVIVNYRYQASFDGVLQDPWKVSSVYRYADGDWLSVHENWSEVKPEPQP